MKVLVACEYSGRVRRAFEAMGHDVISADFEPAEDNSPFHYQGDCFDLINGQHFDLMIAHPPCTYLTCSAEWAYGDGPYHQKVKPETLVGPARKEAREEAIQFVMKLEVEKQDDSGLAIALTCSDESVYADITLTAQQKQHLIAFLQEK